MIRFSAFEKSLLTEDEVINLAESEDGKDLLVSLHKAYYTRETDTYENLLSDNKRILNYIRQQDGDMSKYLSLSEQRDDTLERDFESNRFFEIRHKKFEVLQHLIESISPEDKVIDEVLDYVLYGGLQHVDESDFESIIEFEYNHIKEHIPSDLYNTFTDENVSELEYCIEPSLVMRMAVVDEAGKVSVIKSKFLGKRTKGGSSIIQTPHIQGKKNAAKATNSFVKSLNKKSSNAFITTSKPLNHPKSKGHYSTIVKLSQNTKKKPQNTITNLTKSK